MAVKRKVIVGVASLAALYVGVSNALGLGEMKLDSSLNQPLSATIQLLDAQGLSASDIIVSLAQQDAFDRAGIDRPFFLTDLRFVPVVENNRLHIRVESTRPVREPYLNFLVELRRPGGKILREYTVLLDPPLYDPNTAIFAAPANVQTPARIATPAVSRPSERTPAEPDRKPLKPLPGLRPDSGARQYTTVAGDSLWGIAANQRPDKSVPIRLNMAAIFALNPDAFVGGNIDNLRQGYTLTLPTREQLVSIGAPPELATAGSEESTDQPLEATAGSEEGVADLAEPAPFDGGPVDSYTAADEPDGATPETDRDATAESNAVEGRLRIEEVTPDAVDAGSAELLDRLSAFEGRFNVLLSELDARDAQIASLQAEIEVLQQARAAEERLDDEFVGAAGMGALTMDPASREFPVTGDSAQPAPGAVAINVLPAEQSVTARSPFSWLSWLIIPLVLVAFLLGWLLSRRRNQEEEPETYSLEPQHNSPAGFPSNITPAPVVARPVMQSPAKPGVDPLEGVNLYITYGRFAEARTMLDKAIDAEPERLELRYKQLQVLAELGDGRAFAEQEKAIIELDGDLERVDHIKTRFPLLFNDEGDVVEQVDQLEPLLDEEDEDAAFYTDTDIEDDPFDSSTSRMNLNDFTLDPDWDLIDSLSPEPIRKVTGKEVTAETKRAITEDEFENSLHKFPQVEELDEDRDEHFKPTDADDDNRRGNK